MDKITVKVADLRAEIQANRDNHRAIFEEAVRKFRAEMISVLDKRLNDAKAGRHVDQYLGLLEPEDHTRDYDRVLKMLDMHDDEHIEIDQDEFAQYVMDDWGWKRLWVANTLSYAQAASG
jgi:hypothetical protein